MALSIRVKDTGPPFTTTITLVGRVPESWGYPNSWMVYGWLISLKTRKVNDLGGTTILGKALLGFGIV